MFYLPPPPKFNPPTGLLPRKHAPGLRHRSAVFVVRWSVRSPFDRLTAGEKDAAANAHGLRDRRTTWFCDRAHATPHKSYPGLSLGFDSRLVDEFGHTR